MIFLHEKLGCKLALLLAALFSSTTSTKLHSSHHASILGSSLSAPSSSIDKEDNNKNGDHLEMEARVVGGFNVADPEAYPYFALLEIVYPSKTKMCGATLIHPAILMTAGHCVDEVESYHADEGISYPEAEIGFHSFRAGGGNRITAKVRTNDIRVHPNYGKRSYRNDIALLRLESPVNNVEPVQVQKTERIEGGTGPVTIIGMGRLEYGGASPAVLQSVDTTVISHKMCTKAYGGRKIDDNSQLCAGSDGADACSGDSGGPLLYQNEQVGIVSSGIGCGTYPGIYTRVSNYGTWIDDMVCEMTGDCGHGVATDQEIQQVQSSLETPGPEEGGLFEDTTEKDGLSKSTTTSDDPTPSPTAGPTASPTASPTRNPTASPTRSPTRLPTRSPTSAPITPPPSAFPTVSPTTRSPTLSPTTTPPTSFPTVSPTNRPTTAPTPPPAEEEVIHQSTALLDKDGDDEKENAADEQQQEPPMAYHWDIFGDALEPIPEMLERPIREDEAPDSAAERTDEEEQQHQQLLPAPEANMLIARPVREDKAPSNSAAAGRVDGGSGDSSGDQQQHHQQQLPPHTQMMIQQQDEEVETIDPEKRLDSGSNPPNIFLFKNGLLRQGGGGLDSGMPDIQAQPGSYKSETITVEAGADVRNFERRKKIAQDELMLRRGQFSEEP